MLRLERRDKRLLASFSQGDGRTWKKSETQDIEYLRDVLNAGVSMTTNTNPGCRVKYERLKIEKASDKEKNDKSTK